MFNLISCVQIKCVICKKWLEFKGCSLQLDVLLFALAVANSCH